MESLRLILTICFGLTHFIFPQKYFVKQANVVSEPMFYNFKAFGPESGLKQKRITKVLQDRHGYLWLGTGEKGLVRYNGYDFKTYSHISYDSTSLSNNYVWDVYEDRAGRLWIGTDDGLNYFDHNTGLFQRINTLPDSLKGTIPNRINSITADQTGHIWVASAGIARVRLSGADNAATASVDRFVPFKENIDALKNQIDCVLIDRDQRLWFATNAGFGYLKPPISVNLGPADNQFHFFSYTDLPTGRDIEQRKTKLIETKDGTLWAVTGNTLIKITGPIATPEITIYRFEEASKNWGLMDWLNLNNELAEIESPRGSLLFIGAYEVGIALFDPKTETIQPYLVSNPNTAAAQIPYEGNSVLADRDGIIWVGSEGGLFKYDPYANQFTNYHPALSELAKRSRKYLRFAYKDSRGDFWIGEESVYRCDGKTGEILQTFWPMNPDWKFQNKLLEDDLGQVWFGAEFGAAGGIFRWNPATEEMEHVLKTPMKVKTSFYDVSVTAFMLDHQQHVWAGSVNEYGGNSGQDSVTLQLYEFSGENKNEYHYRFSHKLSHKTNGYIYALVENEPGTIWLGTGRGLFRYDAKNHSSKRYQKNLSDPSGLNNEQIFSVLPDAMQPERYLWLGTNGGGLNRFDIKNEKFEHFTTADGLVSDVINSVLADAAGNLWLGTDQGIGHILLSDRDRNIREIRWINKKNGLWDEDYSFFYGHNAAKTAKGELIFPGLYSFTLFNPDLQYPNPPVTQINELSINHKPVLPLTPDSPLDRAIFLTKEVQLPYDQNTLALEMTGFSFHAPEKIRYQYRMDGVDEAWVDNDRNRKAHYTSLAPGRYTFRARAANEAGVWNEAETRLNIHISPAWWQTTWAYLMYGLLAFVSIFGIIRYRERSLRQQRSELEKAVAERTETIQLQAEELKELDRMKTRFFTNISHEFRTPLTLIMGPVEQVEKEVRQQHLREKLRLVKRNSRRLFHLINQLLDLSRLESKHLKLQAAPGDIVGYTKGIVMGFASWAERKNISLKIVSKIETQKLYFDRDVMEKVLNNLLSNALKFTPSGGKVEVTVALFSKSEERGARNEERKNRRAKGEERGAKRPKDVEQKRLRGEKHGGKFVEIIVRDTGIGIPVDRLPHIFDRFYQVDGASTREHEGSGVGLALTKELVERHYGSIVAESQPDEGTTFHLFFPLGSAHFADNEIVASVTVAGRTKSIPTDIYELDLAATDEFVKENGKSPRAPIPKNGKQKNGFPPKSNQKEEQNEIPKSEISNRKSEIRNPKSKIEKPLVLIVDDHSDFRTYIRDCLKMAPMEYQFLEAKNGKAGVDKAIEKIPDLIISDVMMPKMNGYELCKTLKLDERTSHIPIILLTARAEQQDKLTGLKTGADDYLNKPFDTKELLARVDNLIEQRRKLQNRFQQQMVLKPSEINVNSMDEAFLQKALAAIEAHIDDEKFDVPALQREVGMSRSHLHAKLKALTNQSATEFIRSVRLHRAADLLKQNAGSISEIAYQVGFGSQSYFTRCFQKQFGVTPKQFQKRD